MSRAPLISFLVGSAGLLGLSCSSAGYTTATGAPTVVLPAHFAEGNTGKPASSSRASEPTPAAAGASATPPDAGGAPPTPSAEVTPLAPSGAPDPAALRMAEQVAYELELRDGKVNVVAVNAVTLPEPIVTSRRIGRYAIELSIGSELIERVRFDFPGTAADEPSRPGAKKPLSAPLTFSERAIARVKVLVPHSARVRRAVLVDRALSSVVELAWPFPEIARAKPAATPSEGASGNAASRGQ